MIFEGSSISAERQTDGSIRLVHVIATLSQDQWALLVATMSAKGDNPENTKAAEDFHKGALRTADAALEAAIKG